MKNKIILLVFIILFFNLVSAATNQEKMLMKSCSYSLNDKSFGIWDQSQQKGVFLKINNSNLNFGSTQVADYKVVSFQNSQGFYNPYGYYNPSHNYPFNSTSTIPIISVSPGNENILYVNCTFKINPSIQAVYPKSYHFIGGGMGDALVYPTYDFNLSNELVNLPGFSAFPEYNNYTLNKYYQAIANPLSSYGEDSFMSFGRYPISKFRGISYGFRENTAWSPASEITLNTSAYLGDTASGLSSSLGYLRENADMDLVNKWTAFFYIDSSTKTIQSSLYPIATKYTCTNPAGGIIYSAGDSVYANITFKNPYPVELTSQNLTAKISDDFFWAVGMRNIFGVSQTLVSKSIFHTFAPNEEFNFSLLSPISLAPHPYIDSIYQIFDSQGVLKSPAGITTCGADSVSYLGFWAVDPRIEIINNVPTFKLTLDLTVFQNPAPLAYSVSPGEYDLWVQIYNSTAKTNNLVSNTTIHLNQTEFDKMGKSVLIAPTSSAKTSAVYTITIPVEETFKSETGNYYVNVYSIKNNAPFAGKIGALDYPYPFFKPGKLMYASDTMLNFGPDSKTDAPTGGIMVSNPSFSPHTIKLSLYGPADNNFVVFDYPSEISLDQFGQQLINLKVNATHNPWPSSNSFSNFTLSATSDEAGVEPTNITFFLNLSTLAIGPWLDLSLQGHDSPSEVVINYLGDTRHIYPSMNFTALGPEGITNNLGQQYNVSIQLFNQNLEKIAENKTNFSIDNILHNFTTDFLIDSSTNATWKIKFIVDSDSSISEIDSSKLPSESNNNFESDLLIKVYSANCPDFTNVSGCLERACTWNCSNGQCPPLSILPGNCDFCTSFTTSQRLLGCSVYNNNESCIADSTTCQLFRVSRQTIGGLNFCDWDTNSNSCYYPKGSIVDPTVICHYSSSVVQTCAQGDKYIINNTDSAQPIKCPYYLTESLCTSSTVQLPFFSGFNFIVTILVLVCFYVVIKVKRVY